jgi:hypothetical protein
MAFKIILNGWPSSVTASVVMSDKTQLEQVRRYLLDDDRHGCTPSEITVVDEATTHESFTDWLSS